MSKKEVSKKPQKRIVENTELIPYRTTLQLLNLKKLPKISDKIIDPPQKETKRIQRNSTSQNVVNTNFSSWKSVVKLISSAHLKLLQSNTQKMTFFKKNSACCVREIKRVFSKTGKFNPFNKNKRFKREMQKIFGELTGKRVVRCVNKEQRKQERIENEKKGKEANQRQLDELLKKTEIYSSYVNERQGSLTSKKAEYESDSIKISAKLAIHQKEGVDWLIKLFKHGLNGILADDMGLGKTIQSLALLSWISENKKTEGPFLIISPSSTLHNWTSEVEKFLPHFEIHEFWGEGRKEKIRTLKKNIKTGKRPQIVIVSYSIAVLDVSLLCSLTWCYIVVDEAQSIKSSTSARWKTLLRLKTEKLASADDENLQEYAGIGEINEFRHMAKEGGDIRSNAGVGGKLLLTGTPIQNNLGELWSLLHFVMPKFFSDREIFNEWFAKSEDDATKKKRKLSDKLRGGSVQSTNIQLFSKSMIRKLKEVLKPFMLRREKKDILGELPKKISRTIELKMNGAQLEIYNKILDGKYDFYDYFRQTANLESDEEVLEEDADSRKNLQMHLRKTCNHPFLMRESFLKTPFFVSKAPQIYSEELLDISIGKYSNLEFCGGKNLKFEMFSPDIFFSQKLCLKKEIKGFHTLQGGNSYLFNNSSSLFMREKAAVFPKHFSEERFHARELEGLENEKLTSYPYPLATDVVSLSCKMRYLAELLPELLYGGKKCLVYFQMTKMIDIFQRFCENFRSSLPADAIQNIRKKFPNQEIPKFLNFRRLDGSDTLANRKVLVESFSNDDSVFLFLLSTRAAGVGLNLVSADTVIFYDRDWNPTVDMQAEDRVHRIGQTKPVTIYKFKVKESIEEIVEETGERKGEMMKNVLVQEKNQVK